MFVPRTESPCDVNPINLPQAWMRLLLGSDIIASNEAVHKAVSMPKRGTAPGGHPPGGPHAVQEGVEGRGVALVLHAALVQQRLHGALASACKSAAGSLGAGHGAHSRREVRPVQQSSPHWTLGVRSQPGAASWTEPGKPPATPDMIHARRETARKRLLVSRLTSVSRGVKLPPEACQKDSRVAGWIPPRHSLLPTLQCLPQR